MEDSEFLFQVFSANPRANVRTLCELCGWPGNTARLHRAMTELALDKRVAKVGSKWKIVNLNKELD